MSFDPDLGFDEGDIILWVAEVQHVLRVNDWRIDLKAKPELTDSNAYVVTQLQQRTATIYYNPTADKLRYYLAHEVGHIMLADMAYRACDGRDVGTIEAYTFLEERVCDVIADLLYEPAEQLP